MSKFTPGPWAVLAWRDHKADVHGFSISAGDYFLPVSNCTGDIDEAEANARLIEAAPSLHDLLTQCAEYLECIPESAAGGDDQAVKLARAARAALAKVEGCAE